ncbi:MAG: hypothetical protein GQ564_02785 [Bacteroidales bacterium]|nr:hypothetical protein [Bacteroidales bacterium]
MKKIILLFSIFALLFNTQSFAQKDTTKIDGIIYSFVPQYLIIKGIRIDIEKQITPRSFIQFSPQFYLGENNQNSIDSYSNNFFSDDDEDFNKILGGGLNVYHKIFANDDFLNNGVYFSYGLSYSYYEIEYYEDFLGSTIDNEATIQKYGGDILIGYQLFFKNKLSLDIYTGIGSRFSNMDTNGSTRNKFNSNYSGYNYQGNLLHLGFRIGLIL